MYSTKLVNFVAFLVIFQSNFLSYSNSMFGLVSQLNFCSHQADDEPMNNNEEITSTRTKNSQCIPKRWPTSYTLHFQIIRNVEVLSTEQRWYTRYWLYDTETTIIITHEFHGDTSLKRNFRATETLHYGTTQLHTKPYVQNYLWTTYKFFIYIYAH